MSKKRTSVLVGFFLLLIILFHFLGWLTGVEQFFRSLTLPGISQIHAINVQIGTRYELFKNRNDLEKAYAACRMDNESYAVSTAQLKELQQENSELRAQLNFLQTQTSTYVTADVVGKEILSPDQTIIINRGTKQGIKEDDPVISGSGILVGKILKVDTDTSIVRLITDNLSRIGATILNHDRSIGVVEGGYNVSLIMDFIPRDEVVQKDDQIVTSGLESGIPRGILIGTVNVVENEPYKPFQQAYLSPATDLSKLSVVTVLLTH